MARSTITSKFQTTVPKEVREKLGVRPGDRLVWKTEGNVVRLVAESNPLDRLMGSLKVGRGNVLEDIRKARDLRGLERI